MASKKPFWESAPKPSGAKLTSRQKSAAKARAARAGRRYPNLVDNAWASRKAK